MQNTLTYIFVSALCNGFVVPIQKKVDEVSKGKALGTTTPQIDKVDHDYSTLLDRIMVSISKFQQNCILSRHYYLQCLHMYTHLFVHEETKSTEKLPTIHVDYIMPYHTPIT